MLLCIHLSCKIWLVSFGVATNKEAAILCVQVFYMREEITSKIGIYGLHAETPHLIPIESPTSLEKLPKHHGKCSHNAAKYG